MSWQIATFAALAAVLIGGFAWYERSRPPARLVAVVAALAALAVAGRLVLAPIPNVLATTDIALLTGYALGPVPGFAVGALAAPVSNIWLGQGPWTAWQMAGWGLIGLAGAWLAAISGRRLGRLGLAAACGLAGLAYGALLDLSVMVTYGGEQSVDRYLALSARGVPFNVAHALGNVVFALAAGPALVRMIGRYRTRLEFRWHPAGALPLALVALAAALAVARPPAAPAATSAEAWLVRHQSADGGYGASPGFDSSPSMTGWAMLGLEAAGRNPLDVAKRGNTPVSYLREQVGRLRATNDLERTILALEGAGVDSRRFAGIDLVAELRSRRSGDGSISGQVNLTAFFVLAMRAAGAEAADLGRPARWLRAAQNRDGGWGFNPGAPSDPDSTGAALQALAAVGNAGKAIDGGVRWLRREQRSSGGWGLNTTGVVNAQSTAWAVQGMVAVGAGGAAVRDGIAYLERLQTADGHYRYSTSTDQTPIWVTAQALLAIEREPLPLAPVARRARSEDSRDPVQQAEGPAEAIPSGQAAGGAAGGRPASPAREPQRRTGGGDRGDRGSSSADRLSPAPPKSRASRLSGLSAATVARRPAQTGPAEGSATGYAAANLAILALFASGLWWWQRRSPQEGRGAPTTR